MLYAVEIGREREDLAKVMSAIREWLDAQQFEPDAFRCTTDDESITCRLEFKRESEAAACANAFGAQISSIGDSFLA
jgi:tryptophanyl-tRNA synthetase